MGAENDPVLLLPVGWSLGLLAWRWVMLMVLWSVVHQGVIWSASRPHQFDLVVLMVIRGTLTAPNSCGTSMLRAHRRRSPIGHSKATTWNTGTLTHFITAHCLLLATDTVIARDGTSLHLDLLLLMWLTVLHLEWEWAQRPCRCLLAFVGGGRGCGHSG